MRCRPRFSFRIDHRDAMAAMSGRETTETTSATELAKNVIKNESIIELLQVAVRNRR